MNVPVFYDCEASGLNGVPIEIGWAWADGTARLHGEAHLIRPEIEWNIDAHWDRQAEALHQISRDELRQHGKPIWRTVQRMNHALAGRELFADSPFDEHWLRQMFEAAGVEPDFTIRRMSAEVLIEQLANERGMNAGDLERARAWAVQVSPRRHRAGADACHLARLWNIVRNGW